MTPINGYVIVAPKKRNDKIVLSNGQEIFIDTRFQPGAHSEILCDVIAIPEKKTKSMELLAGDWECDIDIEVGDEVYCDYRNVNMNIDDVNGIYYINDRRCITIHYKNMFVAKRKINKTNNAPKLTIINNDFHIAQTAREIAKKLVNNSKRDYEIIMLNGYVLLEPYKNDRIWFSKQGKSIYNAIKRGFEIPNYIKERMDNQMGIVRYIGKPNKKYCTAKSKWVDSEDIKVGDIVVFLPERDIFLEYSLHASLEGKKQFYRIQNHDIIAKIEI